MDELRAKGVESLAIHNSNGSNGQMFKLEDWAGNPMDDDYGAQRIRNEPIVEITQIKAPQRRTHCFQPATNLRALKSCPIALPPMRSARSTGLTPGRR